MSGEVAENKLYDAALTGDVTTFRDLLQQDPPILERVSFLSANKTPPLHAATLHNKPGIVREVLKRNPLLAQQLDSQKSSPLHIAAAIGSIEIANLLLSAAPKMCWRHDCHGMNPFHVAAMNGHDGILEMLILDDPSPAREQVHRGQTALHLCVKHGHIQTLKVLVERFPELVSVGDDDGDTILHLAARCNQYEIIQFLVENNHIEKSIRNSKGETTLYILEEMSPTDQTSAIKEILLTRSWKLSSNAFNKFREIVMVIAVLIATMAFQAVVSPPGGVWQDNSSTHRAGAAVMSHTHPKIYTHFVRANTVAFVSSLIIIFSVTTGLSSIHFLVTTLVMHIGWVSMASIAVSYGISVMMITPNTETQSLASAIGTVVAVPVSIIGLLWALSIYKSSSATSSVSRMVENMEVGKAGKAGIKMDVCDVSEDDELRKIGEDNELRNIGEDVIIDVDVPPEEKPAAR